MLKFSLKYMIRNKKKSWYIILGIVMSVMLMFSLNQISDSIVMQYRHFALCGNNEDVKITDLNSDEGKDIIKELSKSYPNTTFSLNRLVGEIDFGENSGKKATFCIANWEGVQRINNFIIKEGKYPEEPFDIVLEYSVWKSLYPSGQLGDEIALKYTDLQNHFHQLKFKVSGIVEDTVIQTRTVGRRSFAFTSTETQEELESIGVVFQDNCSLDIMLDRDSYDEEKVRLLCTRCYDSMVPGFMNKIKKIKTGQLTGQEQARIKTVMQQVEVNELKMETFRKQKDESGILVGIRTLSIMIAFSMLLLVFNSIHLSVVERIGEYGMLRCIGLSRKQLYKMLAWENFMYGSIGYIIGIALGCLFNHFFAKKILQLLFNREISMVHSLSSYLLTFALVAISVLVAVLMVVIKIRCRNPRETSEYSECKNRMKMVKENQTKFSKLFVTRNIKRNRTKSITVVGSLMVCTILIMIIFNILGSIEIREKDVKSTFSDYQVVYSYDEGFTKGFEEKTVENFKKLHGIKRVFAMDLGLRWFLYKEDGTVISYIVCNDEMMKQLMQYNHQKGEYQVVLIHPEKERKENDVLEVNKKYQLLMEKIDTREKKDGELVIEKEFKGDIFDFANGLTAHKTEPTVVMSQQAAKKLLGNITYTDIMLDYIGNVTDTDKKEISEVVAEYDHVMQGGYDDNLESSSRMLLGMIILVLYFVIVAVFTAIGNMNTIIRSNIVSYRKEHMMLRILGLTQKKLVWIICCQNVLLALIACIISLFIAVPVQIYFSIVSFDEIRINLIIYLLIMAVVIGINWFIAYMNTRKLLIYGTENKFHE